MSRETGCRGIARRPLLARIALPSLVLLLSGWLSAGDRGPEWAIDNSSAGGTGTGGTGAVGGSGGGALLAGTGGRLPTPTPVLPPCTLFNSGVPVFADRAFSNDRPARRELFTWTTKEQIQELRAGSVLLTRTERAGMGPGYAMQALAELGMQTASGFAPDSVALAALLSGPQFAKAR